MVCPARSLRTTIADEVSNSFQWVNDQGQAPVLLSLQCFSLCPRCIQRERCRCSGRETSRRGSRDRCRISRRSACQSFAGSHSLQERSFPLPKSTWCSCASGPEHGDQAWADRRDRRSFRIWKEYDHSAHRAILRHYYRIDRTRRAEHFGAQRQELARESSSSVSGADSGAWKI